MEIRVVQKSIIEIFEGDKILSQTIVGNDLQLGIFHDCNMMLKGWTIDRMIAAQKDEEALTEEKKAQENQPCAEVCA